MSAWVREGCARPSQVAAGRSRESTLPSEMVALARARIPHAASRLVHGAVEELPFASGSFDVVTATGVLEYADVPRARGDRACGETRRRRCRELPEPARAYSLWKDYVWHPLVRHLKRLLGRGAKVRPETPSVAPETVRGDRRRSLSRSNRRGSLYLLLPAPLDEMFPGLTERVGQRMDGSAGPSARLFGTQAVYLLGRPPVANRQRCRPKMK